LLRIRMTRMGGKKDPHYRVVVAEKRGPRDGRFVEIVGFYNPALNPIRLKLDLERVDYWIGKGAQPSETVRSLIKKVKAQESAPIEEPEPAAEEKAEKAEKAEKTEKAEKAEKAEEPEKAEKAEKAEEPEAAESDAPEK